MTSNGQVAWRGVAWHSKVLCMEPEGQVDTWRGVAWRGVALCIEQGEGGGAM